MPRLETPLGRDGPIIDVRIWIGPEHEEALKARGLQAPRPLSVPGLLDTLLFITHVFKRIEGLQRQGGVPVDLLGRQRQRPAARVERARRRR